VIARAAKAATLNRKDELAEAEGGWAPDPEVGKTVSISGFSDWRFSRRTPLGPDGRFGGPCPMDSDPGAF